MGWLARLRAAAPSALGMAVALALAGCGESQPPMTTLEPKSNMAQWIYTLFVHVTEWDAFVFLVVVVAFVLAVFFFSTRVGESAPPSTKASDVRLEIAWTVGPALILLMISIPTVRTIFRTQPPTPPKHSLRIRVIAHQWWWEFRYLDKSKIITADEMHIPTGRPIRLSLQSADVIHSFWVPALGGKRDVVPGQINEITFIARGPGMYLGQCAEFCGESHANMRFRVFVQSPAGFDAWEKAQLKPPVSISQLADPAAVAGAKIFANSPCTACHMIEGASKGYLAPNLTHFGSRTTLAGGILSNTPHNLAAWITNPQRVKPGAKMPKLALSGADLHDLVAYLESLK
jgi:cytochrome c oxidase subunit II